MPRGHFNHAGRIGMIGGSLPKGQTNLTKLFSILKGGSGSGNFGHAGRKGQKGGSVARNGVLILPQRLEAIVGNAEQKRSMELAVERDPFASIKYNWDAIDEVAKIAGVDSSKVYSMVYDFGSGGTEGNLQMLKTQESAAKALGVPVPDFINKEIDKIVKQSEEYAAKGMKRVAANMLNEGKVNDIDRQKIIKAMYDHTQQKLKKAGLKEDDYIEVFRGVTSDDSEFKVGKISSNPNPLQSWSTDRSLAERFAKSKPALLEDTPKYGAVVKARVKVKDIHSGYNTGFGLAALSEVVVIGPKVEGSEVVDALINDTSF